MTYYKLMRGNEAGPYVQVSVKRGEDGTAVAILNNVGPGVRYIPAETLAVPEALLIGSKIAGKAGVPFLVVLDDTDWSPEWGEVQ